MNGFWIYINEFWISINREYIVKRHPIHVEYSLLFLIFYVSDMAKKKTRLTIKISKSRKKQQRLGRQRKSLGIPRPCVKWPGLLDVLISPQISSKKKQDSSPIKSTDRKRK